MSHCIAQAIILAEDLRSGSFLRRYVMRALNLVDRQVRLLIAPPGAQSGFDWVIQRYPLEMVLHRHQVSKGPTVTELRRLES